MNLYIRLLFRILLNFFFRSKVNVDDETALTFRVLPTDLDCNCHVNNGRYLSLMDIGRLDLIDRIGVLRPALKKKWIPVIGDVQISFKRPLHLFQKYTLKTKITHWDQKWFYFDQRFERNGRTIAHGTARGLMYSRQKKAITPSEVLRTLENSS